MPKNLPFSHGILRTLIFNLYTYKVYTIYSKADSSEPVGEDMMKVSNSQHISRLRPGSTEDMIWTIENLVQ